MIKSLLKSVIRSKLPLHKTGFKRTFSKGNDLIKNRSTFFSMGLATGAFISFGALYTKFTSKADCKEDVFSIDNVVERSFKIPFINKVKPFDDYINGDTLEYSKKNFFPQFSQQITDIKDAYLNFVYKSNKGFILLNETFWQVLTLSLITQPIYSVKMQLQQGQSVNLHPSTIFRGVVYNTLPRYPSNLVIWGTQSSLDDMNPLLKAVLTACAASPFIHFAELLTNACSSKTESLKEVLTSRPFAGFGSLAMREIVFCLFFWAGRVPLNSMVSSSNYFDDWSDFQKSQCSLALISSFIGFGTIAFDHLSTVAKQGHVLSSEFVRHEVPKTYKGLPLRIFQVHIFLTTLNAIIKKQTELREKYK
jgi:hypothetical protein